MKSNCMNYYIKYKEKGTWQDDNLLPNLFSELMEGVFG